MPTPHTPCTHPPTAHTTYHTHLIYTHKSPCHTLAILHSAMHTSHTPCTHHTLYTHPPTHYTLPHTPLGKPSIHTPIVHTLPHTPLVNTLYLCTRSLTHPHTHYTFPHRPTTHTLTQPSETPSLHTPLANILHLVHTPSHTPLVHTPLVNTLYLCTLPHTPSHTTDSYTLPHKGIAIGRWVCCGV